MEFVILHEVCAGERLVLEAALPFKKRKRRLITLPAAPLLQLVHLCGVPAGCGVRFFGLSIVCREALDGSYRGVSVVIAGDCCTSVENRVDMSSLADHGRVVPPLLWVLFWFCLVILPAQAMLPSSLKLRNCTRTFARMCRSWKVAKTGAVHEMFPDPPPRLKITRTG